MGRGPGIYPSSMPDGFGRLVRTLRMERGLTGTQLARKCGMGQGTMCHVEIDGRDNPRARTITKIAGGLGIDPVDLFREWLEVQAKLRGGEE